MPRAPPLKPHSFWKQGMHMQGHQALRPHTWQQRSKRPAGGRPRPRLPALAPWAECVTWASSTASFLAPLRPQLRSACTMGMPVNTYTDAVSSSHEIEHLIAFFRIWPKWV